MPAEKGIPKPEASARRLDVRSYDLRESFCGHLEINDCGNPGICKNCLLIFAARNQENVISDSIPLLE
jgi:hypothetical protein